MVFIATFNDISVVSWRLVLLVEETGVPRENHRPAASHWQTLFIHVVTVAGDHENILVLQTMQIRINEFKWLNRIWTKGVLL